MSCIEHTVVRVYTVINKVFFSRCHNIRTECELREYVCVCLSECMCKSVLHTIVVAVVVVYAAATAAAAAVVDVGRSGEQ